MTRFSTISSKGQITVPLEVRERLGLKEGDRVEFVVDAGQILFRPSRPPKNPFEQYVGALPGFHSMDEINDWVHSLRDEDDEPAETGEGMQRG